MGRHFDRDAAEECAMARIESREQRGLKRDAPTRSWVNHKFERQGAQDCLRLAIVDSALAGQAQGKAVRGLCCQFFVHKQVRETILERVGHCRHWPSPRYSKIPTPRREKRR